MKTNTIKKILHSRFDDFIKSIEDADLKKDIIKNSYITGGAIVSLFLDETINDLDIYFTNTTTALKVSEYYIKLFKATHTVDDHIFRTAMIRPENDGIIIDIDRDYGIVTEKTFSVCSSLGDYRPISFTSNAITLVKTSNKPDVKPKIVQLILRFVGTPEEVHKNYDFIHCTNVYLPSHNELILNKDAIESILTKELRYMGSKYPIASVIRTKKYINRGWSINAGQYLKMAFQISELDLRNIDILREQLIGVDSAYFMQFIRYMSENDLTNIDQTVLNEIVDKIFDHELDHEE